MFDAVPVGHGQTMDPAMEDIMPLLKAYLSGWLFLVCLFCVSSQDHLVNEPNLAATVDEDDYVWDVFYHRPASLSEWNSAATVGTL